MAETHPRTPVPGPAFTRLLARVTGADLPASGPGLSGRLGQWFDWNRAVVLSRALDGRLPEPAAHDISVPEDDPATSCARVRATQAGAIVDDGAAVLARVRERCDSSGDAPDYAPFRQFHLARQRSMQAATGQLRGRLRDQLARGPAELARLAEVDAVMELTLSPREQALLAGVPAMLGEQFERLRLAQASAGAAAAPAHPWLDAFSRDMQAVLLAELDVRFHPIQALLAALDPQTLPDT